MRWGNISNQTAPIVAVNVDNILFAPKEDSFINQIKKFLHFDAEHFKYFNRNINQENVYLLNNIWSKNDISLYLITFTDYHDEIAEILNLEDVFYTRLQKAPGVDWLRRKCMYGYSFYFDSDVELLSVLSVDNAKNISEAHKFLKV